MSAREPVFNVPAAVEYFLSVRCSFEFDPFGTSGKTFLEAAMLNSPSANDEIEVVGAGGSAWVDGTYSSECG